MSCPSLAWTRTPPALLFPIPLLKAKIPASALSMRGPPWDLHWQASLARSGHYPLPRRLRCRQHVTIAPAASTHWHEWCASHIAVATYYFDSTQRVFSRRFACQTRSDVLCRFCGWAVRNNCMLRISHTTRDFCQGIDNLAVLQMYFYACLS